jgi:hypothetical protein
MCTDGDLGDEFYARLSPQGWAWEWMRRNPLYQQYEASLPKVRRTLVRDRPRLMVIESPTYETAREWNLLFPEEASRFFGDAAVFWRNIDKTILPVSALAPTAGPTRDGLFDITQLPLHVAVLESAGGGEEVLISNGVQSIQLHIVEGTVLSGPVQIAHLMTGIQDVREHFITIERLSAVRRLGSFPNELFPPDPRAERWLLALRAFDFARGGLSQSEIAERLYKPAMLTTAVSRRSDWPSSRVRRLLGLAQRMVNGGYLSLLM